MQDAAIKHGDALIAIEEGFFAKRILLKEQEALAMQKIAKGMDDTEIKRLKNIGDADQLFFERKAQQIQNNLDEDKRRQAAADTNNLTDLEKLKLRESIFNQELELIDLNLQSEIAAIDQKKQINLQYVEFAQGIGNLLKTLAGENKATQAAALIVEKGAAIAKVVVDANAAIARSRAFAASIPAVLPPNIPNARAKLTAEIASARDIKATKIGAAIAIANILATTISSFKKPAGSEGGSGSSGAGRNVTVEAPDFNVVGASQTSVLAQSVSQQVNKPVKAFVVGKEITSQQELDRNINNTAGI